MGTREDILTHPSEEELEVYAFGRAKGRELERLEEHLLICARCQDTLAESDDFIAVMKRATQAIQKDRPIGNAPRTERNWLSGLRIVPKPALLGALGAVVLCLLMWAPSQPPAAYESQATLQTLRGMDGRAPVIRAGKPFLIKAEVGELPQAPAYRVEIAAADGTVVWQESVQRRDSMVSSVVARRLAAGRYWVRLSDTQGTLLREYGLESR